MIILLSLRYALTFSNVDLENNFIFDNFNLITRVLKKSEFEFIFNNLTLATINNNIV